MIFQSSPLHCSARYGHLSVVEYLIKNGADINAKTESVDI